MPRTKVSKSSKRNREAGIKEEKVREFETYLDGFESTLNGKARHKVAEVESDLQLLLGRTSATLLQLTMADFMKLNLSRFCDWQNPCMFTTSSSSLSVTNSISASMMRPLKLTNPNDEGYITEDSVATSGSGGSAIMSAFMGNSIRGRTPGPLSSARGRRPRRSKSACGENVLASAQKQRVGIAFTEKSANTTGPHVSRIQMNKTPLVVRQKAHSADRSVKMFPTNKVPSSPPTAFMRWPKPGEMVLSQYGSPIVAQIMPDKYANVNIPVKDGVLSLRPKKLAELNAEIIEAIEPETLNQIRTLHANLNLIVNLAANK